VAREQGGTREEIKKVALELFLAQGYRGTSLREIAERLEITKAALYYHFRSKEDLLRELVQPLAEDIDATTAALPEQGRAEPRAVFEGVFDLACRHGALISLLLRDVSAFASLAIVERMFRWREQLNLCLLGADAPLDAQVRATLALGGLQDTAVIHLDTPPSTFRETAVDAALRAFHAPQ
jgi:AcrR family transcriptional regulator